MTGSSHKLVLGSLALSILVLAACVPGPLWTKEGLTRDELTTDSKACLEETGDYAFLDFESPSFPGPSPGLRSSYSGRVSPLQTDVYRLCMRSRGYANRRAPAEETPEE